MARTYDNLYPLYAHDPACRCCHPNDRPYCDCPCHRGPSRGEVAALRSRWDRAERIPEGEAIGARSFPRPMPMPPPQPQPQTTPPLTERLAELRRSRRD